MKFVSIVGNSQKIWKSTRYHCIVKWWKYIMAWHTIRKPSCPCINQLIKKENEDYLRTLPLHLPVWQNIDFVSDEEAKVDPRSPLVADCRPSPLANIKAPLNSEDPMLGPLTQTPLRLVSKIKPLPFLLTKSLNHSGGLNFFPTKS